jgi:glycerophosphoryl diester phosphodiesterase
MGANAPQWLAARPIAHRGLHDRARGIIENTLGAADAAIAGGFSIECDVQLSRDGEAIVFHDATLGRLTHSSGALAQLSAAEIGAIAIRDCGERIPTLIALLDRIGGKVPLFCEIKSGFSGDMRLADRVARLALDYSGPLAIKSFDPAIIAHLRASPAPTRESLPLGVVAEASYASPYWRALSDRQKSVCQNFLHLAETRPDFLSWNVDDLPHPTPFLLRRLASMPALVWTVRTAAQKRAAAQWADQIIFEGDPEA